MTSYFKGMPIFGARGPAGPDGTPIGTIISFMGTEAPQDYVICDGAEYNITDYYDLCKFFQEQFGSVNYFGGDGVTTFAVPDLRNLFLRGFHGEATDQLSGDIGVKQAATTFPDYVFYSNSEVIIPNQGTLQPINKDTSDPIQNACRYTSFGSVGTYGISKTFTSRPVNAAVLYCIKAAVSFPVEDVYSLEEQRIGTWTDGKPIYRKILPNLRSGAINTTKIIGTVSDLDLFVRLYGCINNGSSSGIVSVVPNAFVNVQTMSNGDIQLYVEHTSYVNQPLILIIEYTKTTDVIV